MANTPQSLRFRQIPAASLAIIFASGSALPLAQAQQTKPSTQVQADSAPEPTVVPDEQTRKRARDAYAAGEAAFGEANYDEAYASFKLADELIPSPHAQLWMAKTLDAKSASAPDLATLEAYEAFLGSPQATAVGEEKLAEAKTRADTLKATLYGQLKLTVEPANAIITIDGKRQVGPSPLELSLPAGKHIVTVEAEGYKSQEVQLELSSGEAIAQGVALVAEAPPPPPPPPVLAPQPAATPAPVAVEERSMVPAYVTLGIAAVGAGVGTVFGIKALGAKSDFDDKPTTDAANDVERNALIADMAFGVAVTLGITGIVLLAAPDEDGIGDTAQASHGDLRVAPYVSPDGGGAAARWTF